MVIIYPDISMTVYGQVKISMPREQLQHMVQEAAAGINIRLAGTVQGQGKLNLRLFRLPMNG